MWGLLKWPNTLTMEQYYIVYWLQEVMKIIDVLFLCFHLYIMWESENNVGNIEVV